MTLPVTRPGQRGFTLLEVLVAFTLLALLFAALFEVFAGGLTAARIGQVRSHAALLAQSKLAELSADHGIGPGDHVGVFDVNDVQGPRFRWRAELDRYGEDDLGRTDGADVVPYTLTLEIEWNEDGNEGRLTLSSLVLRPK